MFTEKSSPFLGFFIALGFAFLSFGIYKASTSYRDSQRTVVVKGLSEREVESTLVVWPIVFTRDSNYLNDTNNKIDEDLEKVLKFLKANGISDQEIIVSTPQIKDRYTRDYVNTSNIKFRFNGEQVVTVRSSNIKLVIDVQKKSRELINDGILLKVDSYQNKTRFMFTELNKIKPDMIKQATESARETAEKFARDSKSKLGKIKRASQGLFSVNNLDVTTPHIKKVRVVTTVTYFLED